MASSEWYLHGTYPTTSSALASSAMRSQLDLITSGISAKLPDLAGNGLKIVGINSGATALTAVATTGTGSVVLATSPALTTPSLGVATATSINGLTITTSTGTLTIAAAKVFTVSNTLTFTGTDSSSVAFGTGGTVAYTANKLSVFASTTSAELSSVISNESGSGLLVFNDTPTLIAPLLGTPTSGNLANCTGFPTASLSGLGTGVATFLATPSSANLAAAVTDETGSGLLVFATSPQFTTPLLGTPTSGVLTNCTGTAAGLTAGNVTTNANLTGPITSTGNATALAAQTGTGSVFVVQNTPTLTTPNIGAATGASLSISGSFTSTVATGTAPLIVSSATNVANLNASSLSGATFAAPGAIGGGTPSSGAFTTISASGITSITNATASTTSANGALVVAGGAGIGGALNIGGAVGVAGDITQSSATARVTFSSTTGNGGVQNSNGGAVMLMYGGSHATRASAIDIAASGGINLLNGTAVTGTGSFSGLLSANANLEAASATGEVKITSTTGTNNVRIRFDNTGGTYYAGVESSTSSEFGATAYAMTRYIPAGRVYNDIIVATGIVTSTSAAGFVVTAGFGCNTKTAQGSYASGGALAAYGAGINGFDTAPNAAALHAMVVSIRAALVANGIMS